jgi:hypothetical protein
MFQAGIQEVLSISRHPVLRHLIPATDTHQNLDLLSEERDSPRLIERACLLQRLADIDDSKTHHLIYV